MRFLKYSALSSLRVFLFNRQHALKYFVHTLIPNAPCFRELDLTSQFVGRTVHAEYLYSGFEGHWIGPYGDGSDISMAEYDGYLRASTEQNIYDPGSGVRLHFEDCYEGFVCIRSRWREDDISGNGNNPDSRYLQVTSAHETRINSEPGNR